MQHRRFAIMFMGICVAGYVLLLSIGRSPLYCRYSRSYFDVAPCFKVGITGSRADIVLVGDSSLLYGIRPDLVAAAGGGTVYNLGMVGPSFSYQVADLIDGYLAANRRPRAIILYFAPGEAISHDRVDDPFWAPLGIYLLRHGSWSDIAHFLTIRLSAIVEMPPIIVTGLTMTGPPISKYAAEMQAAGGYVEYANGKRALAPDCQAGSFKNPGVSPSDNRTALADLRRRYRAQGIALFVYVAPTALCDNGIGAVRRKYAGVADNFPQALPSEDFTDDTPLADHVHASSAGVPVLSAQLAQFIRTRVAPRLAAHR